MKELKVLSKYIVKYKYHLLLGVVFVFLSNYFRILQPQVIREALDFVVKEVKIFNAASEGAAKETILKDISHSILMFGLKVLGLALLMGFFMYFMRQTIIVMSRLIEYDMRKELFVHYQNLSLAFYKRNNTGDLMSRITEDVSRVRMAIGPAILYGINLVSMFSLAIYSMVQVSPKLTLYSLFPLPILSFIIYKVSHLINQKSEVIQEQLAVLNSTAQETYSGIRVVKSFVQEASMLRLFSDQTEQFKSKNMDLVKIDAMFFPSMALLIGASTVVTVYVGGLMVIDGSISVGNIAEFVIYVNMLTWPVTATGWIASLVQRAAASQKRLNEFMNERSEIQEEQNPHNAPIKGHIEFKDVSFTYAITGIQALKHVSFNIKQGQKIAIVGRTGCGKSTIADLLVRMYDATSGSIELDGMDLTKWKLEAIRQGIAYVPQEVFLFSETVANNIRFVSNSTDQEVMDMAAKVAVHEDIMGLPEQYQTMVGERGVTLSGGQKQRISIARALIKHPDIVVLDDCLSAVDAETEQKILGFLYDYLSSKTAIIITHRIFSLINFDQILVMDQGELVQIGTHDSLLKQEGLYQDMYNQQQLDKITDDQDENH